MLKRLFDVIISLLLLVLFLPVMLLLAIAIKVESEGHVLFKQVRVTTYGRRFRILKFRSMVDRAEQIGAQLTIACDRRITKIGHFMRSTRLDELPQLMNILVGDMTFVGTRPEVVKYVDRYTEEMYATLLLPAGVTSEASILYKDEYRLLTTAHDIDKTYIEDVMPGKMKYNLFALRDFNITRELKTIVKTVLAVCGLWRVSGSGVQGGESIPVEKLSGSL